MVDHTRRGRTSKTHCTALPQLLARTAKYNWLFTFWTRISEPCGPCGTKPTDRLRPRPQLLVGARPARLAAPPSPLPAALRYGSPQRATLEQNSLMCAPAEPRILQIPTISIRYRNLHEAVIYQLALHLPFPSGDGITVVATNRDT